MLSSYDHDYDVVRVFDVMMVLLWCLDDDYDGAIAWDELKGIMMISSWWFDDLW